MNSNIQQHAHLSLGHSHEAEDSLNKISSSVGTTVDSNMINQHYPLFRAHSSESITSDLLSMQQDVMQHSNRNMQKDVNIVQDLIEIEGSLKIKEIVSGSNDWTIPIYNDVIVEKIYGQGKLYYKEKGHGKFSLLFDSSSLNGNFKTIHLKSGHSYSFKVERTHSRSSPIIHSKISSILMQYRFKYSLETNLY